jgi:DNA polymerase I-like protein with 3'-5' exonuclease and polymerase domains
MAGLFNLPPRATREGDKLLSKKSKNSAKQSAGIVIKGSGGLMQRISTIQAMAKKYLGHLEDQTLCIRSEEEYNEYIEAVIKAGEVGFDTETTSLDPITCTMAGFSLYYPGGKAAYIPLHHVSYITGVEVDDQISEECAQAGLQKLKDNNVKFFDFNACFDNRVANHKLRVSLPVYWDAYVAARLLNENEGDGNNGLKPLHKKYCMNGEGESYSFNTLFDGIPFTHVPINAGYIYAAMDAKKHYELGKFQEPFLTPGHPVCKEKELEDVAWLYHNVELPVIPVVQALEDVGIAFDMKYAQELSEKYHKILEEKEAKFHELCRMYEGEIEAYKRKNPNHKLNGDKDGNLISVSSPTQLAILFYDILNVGVIDKKNPRGTGEDIMLKIDNDLAKAVLGCREVSKLLSTYIDKMPNVVNEATGRIHCKFNQVGADTGRFSSSDPNMQNIPSHNEDIRKMFTASEGYVLLSSDYSAQEPRITSHLSNDEKMIEAYRQGKDVYVEIASLAFDLPYDECKEFRADGTHNSEGKARRNSAKAIVLGICYGKGIPAIAEDLRVTVKKAQEIYDRVMKAFPGLKQFMEDSEDMARTKGYVTTIWGRKRRLPNMQLPLYEFSYAGGVAKDFDPMFDDEDEFSLSTEVDEATIQKYTRLLTNARNWKEKEKIKERAEVEGILIKDNGGYIAEATRQCVNSRVQGSAADQTKLAMILVHNDAQLKEWGFRLLLPVHDELIGECPRENASKVAKRFAELMVLAAKDLKVPSKCDVEVTDRWYGETIEV